MRNGRVGRIEMVIVLRPNVRHIGEKENGGEYQLDDADRDVRNIKGLVTGAAAGGIGGVKVHAANDRTKDPSNTVGRLRQVNARSGVALIPKHRRVRIGNGFEEGEAGSYDANTR